MTPAEVRRRANRRLIIVFVMAGVLYTVGFALTGQQADRNRDLARSVKYSLRSSAVALRQAQVDVCERQNDLRRESNRRLKAHIADRDILLAALRLAAKGGPLATPFVKLRDRELREVHFKQLRIVPCEQVIPEVPKP